MRGDERKMERNGPQEDFRNLNGPKRCSQKI
jgi:hypothetical protein